MKTKILVLVAVVPIFFFAFTPAPVSAAKLENMPVIGAIAGGLEVVPSFLKNVASCSGFLDCVDLPRQAGKAALNGAERIIGTSTLGLVGQYNRDFGVNGPLSKVPFLPDIVGWSGLGLGISFITPVAGWAGQNIAMWRNAHAALPLIAGGFGAIAAVTGK